MSVAALRSPSIGVSPVLLSLAVAALVAAAAFGSSLTDLVARWSAREEYSHGYLIPVISLWLLWRQRDALAAHVGSPSWAGLVLIAAALLMNLVGELTAIYIVAQVGFVVALFGLAIATAGWRILPIVTVPIAFLLFAIPLPWFVDFVLSVRLQLLSSELAGMLIRLFGIPVYIDGNVIDLGNYKLQVVDACSGLRYLFPLMSLGFLAAYLFQAPLWQRALVFLSTIPITILMNSLRIGVIGVLTNYWGTSMAEGALHLFEGWVIFIACALLLMGEMYVLAAFVQRKPFFALFHLPEMTTTHRPPASQLGQHRPITPILACIALLACGAAATLHVASRDEIIPERARFATFPNSFGEWRGRASTLEPDIEKVLGADDYLLNDYAKRDGKAVNLYVAYYNSQRKGSSPHSPLMCIPGGGWVITDHQRSSYPGASAQFPFNRLVIERGRDTQIVYYWFEQRGRKVANEWMSKWYLLTDAITMARSDVALVRYMTSVHPGETQADADARLRSFIPEASAGLNTYLPATGATRTERALLGTAASNQL